MHLGYFLLFFVICLSFHKFQTTAEINSTMRSIKTKEKHLQTTKTSTAVEQILNSKLPTKNKKDRLLDRKTKIRKILKQKKFKTRKEEEMFLFKLKKINEKLKNLKGNKKKRKQKKSLNKKARNKVTAKGKTKQFNIAEKIVNRNHRNVSKSYGSSEKKKKLHVKPTVIEYLIDISCKLKSCHICLNGVCSCFPGFRLVSNSCFDINECQTNNGGCEEICINRPGSYTCSCAEGYQLDTNKKNCTDVNECYRNNGKGICQGTCHNTKGSYFCTCDNIVGTKLAKDGLHCDDIDECANGTSGCSDICYNIIGSAYCACPAGFKLGLDYKTCEDINECENKEILKKCNYNCENLHGSYRCGENIDILSDNDYGKDTTICPALVTPKFGYFNCTRPENHNILSFTGREIMANVPRTICSFMCAQDYKPIRATLYCEKNGKWTVNNKEKLHCN